MTVATFESVPRTGTHEVLDDRYVSAHDRIFDLPPGVRFGVARDVTTLDQAFRLVHDQYVERGYMAARRSGRRVSLYHALPETKVFVATVGSRVVGTVSLVPDSPLGLPMDDIYADELAPFRGHARHLAEASAFAVASKPHRQGAGIAAGLMRILVTYAAQLTRLRELCIAVNPRHVGFYRRFCHFEPFADRKSFAKVNDAPAVGLRLDLDFVRAVARKVQTSRDRMHLDRHGRDDVYEFFFGRRDYYATLRELQHTPADACTSEEAFACFVLADEEVWADAAMPSVSYVASLYDKPRGSRDSDHHAAAAMRRAASWPMTAFRKPVDFLKRLAAEAVGGRANPAFFGPA